MNEGEWEIKRRGGHSWSADHISCFFPPNAQPKKATPNARLYNQPPGPLCYGPCAN